MKRGLDHFIRGMGSINLVPDEINLEDYNPNYSDALSPEEQDAKALAGDWTQVGEDINYALKIKEKL